MTVYFDNSKNRGRRKPWVADVTKAHPDGRELRRKKRARTKAEAKDAEGALEAQLIKELYHPEEVEAQNAPTLSELLPKFFEFYGAHHKPSTTHQVKTNLNRDVLPVLGPRKVNTIQRRDFLTLKLTLKKRGLKNPTSINGVLGSLGSLMRYAEDMNYIQQRPRSYFEPVPPPEDIRTISEEEYRKLLEASIEEPYLYALLRVAVEGGLRIGELLALRWEDVRLSEERGYLLVRRSDWRGQVTSTKSRKAREVQLTAQACEALSELPKKEGEVFRKPSGVPYNYNALRRRLQRLCLSVKLDSFGWHILRHTSLTRMGRSNVPVATIAKMAGHSDLKTTQRYLHADRKDREEAARRIEAISPKHHTPSGPQGAGAEGSARRAGGLRGSRYFLKFSGPFLKKARLSRAYALTRQNPLGSLPLLLSSGDRSSALVVSSRGPQAAPVGCLTGEALSYSFLEAAELAGLWENGGER